MNQAVISVGSNINPDHYIPLAREAVADKHRLMAVSAFVETAPIGFSDQPDFMNGAWLVETALDQDALQENLRQIELKLDRIRTENKFGPRTIDLDIIVWNKRIVDQNVFSREFLKRSVLELLPGLDMSNPSV